MDKPDIQINIPQKGLNREQHNLGESDYSTLLNGLFDGLDSATFSLTNEMSNLLSTRFKDGFKVINATSDIYSNTTYFFLVNPATGAGEFGQIRNIQQVQNIDDALSQCDTCGNLYDLAEPLEDQEQVPLNTYETLLSDQCHIDAGEPEKGFNFSIDSPIKKTVIKNEKCGKTLYFADDYNGDRYIVLDNLAQYLSTGSIVCGEDQTEPTCLDADKLRIFKKYNIPELTPVSIELGGRLKLGTYEFLIAYSDALGNEISEYMSLTNPVQIFDRNNVTLSQAEWATPTNYSIKLEVSGLDTRFSYYKIAVIQTTLESISTPVFYVEGVHTINDNVIIYSGSANKQAITLAELLRENIYLERSEFLAEANNSLIHAGLTLEKEINLQPVVNLMGSFLKWQTHIATENLYENGINTSLFLGYNRDETVPFGVRFLLDGGYKTAVFPLINRFPTEAELEEVDPENPDRMSIEANLGDCNSSGRTKRWQYYNDAEEEGSCGNDDIPTVEVEEQVQKICYIENIAESLAGSITIQLDENYTGLEDYIEENKESCPDAFPGTDLCELLDASNYTEESCLEGLFESNCTDIVLAEPEEIEIASIEGEVFTGVEKEFPDDYGTLRRPDFCNLYRVDTASGEYQQNLEFMYLYMYRTGLPGDRDFFRAFFREYNFTNETCQSADDIQNIASGNSAVQSYFHNYVGADTLAGLQTAKTATCTSADASALFTDKIHEGGLWFKGNVNNRESFILEVSKMNDVGNLDAVINSQEPANPDQKIRISIFNRCSATVPLYCEIFEIKTRGIQYKISITETGFDLEDAGGTITSVAESNLFPNGNFFVVLDNPIIESSGVSSYLEEGDEQTNLIETKYRTAPMDGCYGIATRDIEFSEATITWERIEFRKKSVYSSTCTYEQPIVQNCTAVPFKYGKFAYTESSNTYPDNKELYDSSRLAIQEEDIPEGYRTFFQSQFAESVDEGQYVLRPETDYSCQPIRHFRMPSNKVSPFMYENEQAPLANSLIYPLGVTIDESLINNFLDIAVNNGLIQKQKRDLITGYEILRGDITQDRSILSSGLLYDMRSYKGKDNTDIYYSSYPYNDLGDDKLNYENQDRDSFIPHKYDGEKNDKFTYHSPETDYYKPTLASEMAVLGYMFGKSRGFFDEVKDHSKWVILTSKAKNLAGLLAGIEVATEVAVNLAQAGENFRVGVFGGPAGGGVSSNPVGVGLSIASAALSAISSVLANYGRYRYEWLNTFENLGQPENFASYYTSVGIYNYLQLLQEEGNLLRGLNSAKYLKEGNFVETNDITGERTSINNLDRERSVYLSLGEHPLEYPAQYIGYDNNTQDFNSSSLTFASESGVCSEGKSEEIRKNIASPYVALKNYLPAQYGTINSVKWLTTGYKGDLSNPSSGCLSIFGGDTFISRHSLKRKMPLFNTTAFGLGSLTPFNYKFYANIGKEPRFYADYKVISDFSRNSAIFPEIDYKLRFDCPTKRENYHRPPSKFYLYYYGIPSFLTETRINTNNRTAELGLARNFYPNYGDIGELTQEKNVSIREPNYFFYNDTYSKGVTKTASRTLRDNFEQSDNDCRNDKPNGILWSLPDTSETNFSDPWLIYRPLDYIEFPSSYGKLKDIRTIEREQILIRFENTTAIFDAIDMTIDDGKNPESRNLLNSFARRPLTFSETDLGYGGTQSSQSVSCEFGHFHVDAKRGQVVHISPGGKGMEEISSMIGGKPSGMRNWFKEHLPFKILNSVQSGSEDIDLDNAYNGLGITMGYDSRFRRVFITKRDYKAKTCVEYIQGQGFVECGKEDIISLEDTDYFENVSWTISYSPIEQKWIGWYSYCPNYYIAYQNYFQTGLNNPTDTDEFGLWSHLLSNRTYQVFYGKKYPFIVEYMLKRTYGDMLLKTVGMQFEVQRYHNEFDVAEIEDKPFNKMWVWSPLTNSGELHPVINTGQISQISAYPKTAPDGTYQEVLITKNHSEYTVNYIYNRIIKRNLNNPPWNWDINQIDKTINTDVVVFGGKNILENMRSNVFTVRLQQDSDTRLRYIFNMFASKLNLRN